MISLLFSCAAPPPATDLLRPSPSTSETPPSALPDEAWVLPDVTVIDADGVRSNRWVVVLDGHIEAELSAAPVGGTSRDDLAGLWLTPGLIDSHVHLTLSGTTAWVGDTLADALRAQLRHGVTSVVDVGGPAETFGLRDRIDAGDVLGPSMKALGPMLTTPLSHPCEVFPDTDRCAFAESGDDGAVYADWLVANGADGLKAALTDTTTTPWPTPRLPEEALVAAISGLPDHFLRVAHVDTAGDALSAAAAGIDVLAHPCFVDGHTADVLDLDVWVQSTLGAFSGLPRLADGGPLDPPSDTVPVVVLNSWAAAADAAVLDDPVAGATWESWQDNAADHLAAMIARGSDLVVPASDAGYAGVWHGVGLHTELVGLVELGMDPFDSLVAATAVAAESAGFDDRGRVAKGQRADLLVLDADPLVDLDALRVPRLVVVAGVAYADADLASIDLLLRPAAEPTGAFCFDDRDCAEGVCDLTVHRCAEACDRPYDPGADCGPDGLCLPVDGLVTTETGVCGAPWHSCTVLADDCEPEAYAESCVPVDLDTNACVPTSEQGQGDFCLFDACAAGLTCSPIDGRCWTLCDPAIPDCPPASVCKPQEWEGEFWFGLCLPV